MSCKFIFETILRFKYGRKPVNFQTSYGWKYLRVESVWLSCHFNVPTILKYGSLSFLETQEPVHACAGIALPLPLTKEKGCVASGTLRPHQIPDQRFSQFNP